MSRRKTNPPRRSHTQRPKHARAQPETQRHESPGSFEAEVLRGIAPFAEQELGRLGGMQSMQSDGREAIQFRYQGDWRQLCELRTIVAVYALRRFVVPRPKALLGHQHLRALLALITAVRNYDPAQHFDGFRFSAAGSESTVFHRLAQEITTVTGLPYDPEAGELLLRIRPHPGGWEVLVRLTPRPLSARPWRTCNMTGGLNATVAAAMLELSGVLPKDRMLNAMCGSGTLLIERRQLGPARQLVGVDLDPQALACAHENLAAAGLTADIELHKADATALPFPNHSFELITADMPWGDAIGSTATNARLYPAFLHEAARLATPRGRLVVLTHALKQFEALLPTQHDWHVTQSLQVYHGGHHPKMYLLVRRENNESHEPPQSRDA